MSNQTRKAARAAAAIHERLIQARNVPVQLSLPDAFGMSAKNWHAVSKRQSNTTGHSPPDAFANRSIKTCPTWTDG